MSASTRALDVVPLGVVTIVVCSHGGAPVGTRFWKNDLPAAPSGNRCIRAGRPRATSMNGSLDGLVVADEVELGVRPRQ